MTTQTAEKEPTDLVWLPISLVKKIKEHQGCDGVNNEILSYIADNRLEFKQSIADIDEDILLYRAKMIEARNAFKEAKNAELDALYALWEGFDSERRKLGSMVKQAKEELDPLRQEVNDLKDAIGNLNTSISYINIDRMANFLKTMADCKALADSEKDMMTFLFANFKG